MIDCSIMNRPAQDVSDWFYRVHKELIKFADNLEKRTEELSIDETILFFDTRDVMKLTLDLKNIFPPTIPVQDEYYKNVQLFASNSVNSYWESGLGLAMNIHDATATYAYLRGQNSLFVYADPEAKKKYKHNDNLNVVGGAQQSGPYPYKKSLSYFRWERVYSILTANEKTGGRIPLRSHNYATWEYDWSRVKRKK